MITGIGADFALVPVLLLSLAAAALAAEARPAADLVVLGEDVFAVSPERLRDVKVDITIVGGRVMHGSVTRPRPDQ